MKEIAAFPDALRELIEAELKAGNKIVEISSRGPGASAMLERPVSTRPRKTTGGVSFYERQTSSHSGEFTDADRVYYVLEPPLPPPPPPDMDAIREELARKERASNAEYDTWLR